MVPPEYGNGSDEIQTVYEAVQKDLNLVSGQLLRRSMSEASLPQNRSGVQTDVVWRNVNGNVGYWRFNGTDFIRSQKTEADAIELILKASRFQVDRLHNFKVKDLLDPAKSLSSYGAIVFSYHGGSYLNGKP